MIDFCRGLHLTTQRGAAYPRAVPMGPRQCVQDLALDTAAHPQLQDGVVAASVFVHQAVGRAAGAFYAELRRHTYVTPASYLELLNTFLRLLREQRAAIEGTRARLAVGLGKLLSTADQVAGMQARAPCRHRAATSCSRSCSPGRARPRKCASAWNRPVPLHHVFRDRNDR